MISKHFLYVASLNKPEPIVGGGGKLNAFTSFYLNE